MLSLSLSALAHAGTVVFDDEYVKDRLITKSALAKGRAELPLAALHSEAAIKALPDSFDARTAWPQCDSIGDIYDQGKCGDCWAVSAVTSATDRMCIDSGAGSANEPNTRLSVEHMLGCCSQCGFGCNDGFPNYAWMWLAGKKGSPYGVVSGGQYESTTWCSAYTLKPCNHYESKNDTLPTCEGGMPPTNPACPTACDADSAWKVPFAQDVHQFASAYAVAADEDQIRAEMFAHGPVTTGFNVYSDWVHYTSGVYHAEGGTEMGAHAVRMIGWGEEDGEKYWLVANSFGRKWGDGGYFKIIRAGGGDCGIMTNVVAGRYKLNATRSY